MGTDTRRHRSLDRHRRADSGVIEFYDTATRVLLRANGEGMKADLLKETLAAFENALILGTARRTEAATDSSFNNALAWLEARQVLTSERVATGKRGVRDTRFAPGEKCRISNRSRRFWRAPSRTVSLSATLNLRAL